MEKVTTNSREETQQLGEELIKGYAFTRVLALYGELGSGKTTFVQGLAVGLGITKRIISPTFVIIRNYQLKTKNSNRKTTTQNLKSFYHVDLYRAENKRDVESLGIEEIINDTANIVAIEWAEKIKHLLPKERSDIYFEYVDESKRRITWTKI